MENFLVKIIQKNERTIFSREQIIEVVNKLFVYTDNRQWDKIIDEVFTDSVLFDMSSAGGGEAAILNAKEICNNWNKGLQGIDAIHHQAGNYLLTVNNKEATVEAYAIAIHFKEKAVHGKTL